jgi:hypothetical protein
MKDDFFIGWAGVRDAGHKKFLAACTVILVALSAGLGLLLSARIDDPSASLFDLAPGLAAPTLEIAEYKRIEGIFQRLPYPMLHAKGDGYLLSGDGKRGIDVGDEIADGQVLAVEGVLVRRGTVAMLIVDKPAEAIGVGEVAEPVSLGRFRIIGEICDGKCYPGAMSPGSGLSHRACAILCFNGDVPLIFVSAAPVFGQSFLVLAGPDGKAPPSAIKSFVGLRAALEGEVERRGNVLVFKINPQAAKAL